MLKVPNVHCVIAATCMCVWVCLWVNGRLIEGPLWAVKKGLPQPLYLSCANISEVMSPLTIHLPSDVCVDVGLSIRTITPAAVPEFSNLGVTHILGTVGGLDQQGPTDAEIPPAINPPLFHTMFSSYLHSCCHCHLHHDWPFAKPSSRTASVQ